MLHASIERFHAAHFLRATAWFSRLAPAHQAELIDAAFVHKVRQGEGAWRAGGPVPGWQAVLWGMVKLGRTEGAREPIAYGAVGAGEWFAEDLLLGAATHGYDAIALRDTALLAIPRPLFHQLVASSLPFCHAVMERLGSRLGQALATIEADRAGSAEERLAVSLRHTPRDGRRSLGLCQRDLGSLAGLSRQTTNKALQALRRRGVVMMEGGFVTRVDDGAIDAFLADRAEPMEPAQRRVGFS